MTLDLDITRPFIRPSERTKLVSGVLNDQVRSESRWIEWKSTLDISSTHGLGHIAKAVIGFANRDP